MPPLTWYLAEAAKALALFGSLFVLLLVLHLFFG